MCSYSLCITLYSGFWHSAPVRHILVLLWVFCTHCHICFAVYCLFCITLSCVLCVPQWSIWVFLHQHFTLVSSIIFTVLHLFWWLFVVILCLCSHFWCFYGSFVPLWAFFVCVSATSICLCCEPQCLLLTWRQMKDCEKRLTTVWSVWSFCCFSPDWHTRLSQ